jgi:hypothetical protein
MNARAYIALEVVKNERFYRLEMPVGAPFVDCHEVVLQLSKDISDLEEQAKKSTPVEKTPEGEVNGSKE